MADTKVAFDLGMKPLGTRKGPGVLVAGLGPKAGSVPREPQVTEGDLLLRKSPVEQGLKEVVMLHPFSEAVAKKDQRLTCLGIKRQLSSGGGPSDFCRLVIFGPLLVLLLLASRCEGRNHLQTVAAAADLGCQGNADCQAEHEA